jgi:beta-lactamase regulating signal transducer with metallopeptidase domain
MSAEFFTPCERLLSATANGVYQGMLIALLAGLALRFFIRTNAATRHAVWCGVLLFVTALIPAHLFLSGQSRSPILAATPRPASSRTAIPFAPLHDSDDADSPMANGTVLDPQPEDFSTNTPQSEGASQNIDSKRSLIATLNPLFWNFETAISLPHSLCLCLISAWVLLASFRGWLIARRVVEVHGVKTTSSIPSQRLQTLFDRLRRSLVTRRHARLRLSGTHRGAVVLGFVHPVVLLPTEMDKETNEGEVEHVLRHELAHVDRRDDWTNLAQQIIEAALFFHPAVWWISARISLEREIACDDHVLEASGQPRAYALTLANVAIRRSQCRHLLAPGVSNNSSQLQQRITMILNTNRNRSPRLAMSRLGVFTTATALLAVLAIGAGPRLVLAQSTSATTAATTSVNPPTSSEPAPVAEETPAALPPDAPGAESGPRYKTSASSYDAAPGISVALSAPPAPESPATTAVAPVAPISAAPPMPPTPPLDHPRRKHMSVEERLDRLERILDELEANGEAKGRHHSGESYSIYGGPKGQGNYDAWSADSRAEMELKRAADEAKRAEERARRSVEAGKRSAEQAMREVEKMQDKVHEQMEENLNKMKAEAPIQELQALREARNSLEIELRKLDRQIKRLEDDPNGQKKPSHDKPDDSGDNPTQEKTAPVKTL